MRNSIKKRGTRGAHRAEERSVDHARASACRDKTRLSARFVTLRSRVKLQARARARVDRDEEGARFTADNNVECRGYPRQFLRRRGVSNTNVRPLDGILLVGCRHAAEKTSIGKGSAPLRFCM